MNFEFMNAIYDLTPIVEAVIALILAVISCMLIPYVKNKFTEDQLSQLSQWVQIAVNAAEQLFQGQGEGKTKKQYVISLLQTKGYPINNEKTNAQVNALVENAVYELNKGVKQ